jgi:arsenate reductase-like glutaredoxin family protein
VSCGRAQGFLARKKLDTVELVDARKQFLTLKDALALVANADELIAAKGKKVERIDLRAGRPDKATIERLMIGPTGRLRAPTLRIGRTLLVGFDEASYRRLLG